MARISNSDGIYWTGDNSNLSWDVTVAPSNPTKNSNKDIEMKKKFAETRAEIAQILADALGKHDTIRVLSQDDDTTGPLDGKSSVLIGFRDDGTDGGLVAFAVNIYADGKIEDKADRIVDALDDEREKRKIVFGTDEA